MYLSGVYVVKDVIGEIVRRLGPRDLVSFGFAARRIVRNGKAVKRAATDVLQQCSNRKKAHKLQKKRLNPWTVLTMWEKGQRFEQQQLATERALVLKIMQLGRAQIGGHGWNDVITAIRVFSRFEFSIMYRVNTELRTVECALVECSNGAASRSPKSA